MAGFAHAVRIARAPEEVFPWLLDADRVPRWTGDLEGYEVIGGGPVREGSRVRQALEVSGHRIDVEMTIRRHDPPRSAESRFSTNGIDVVTTYVLRPDGDGTELTQTLEAKAGGLSARMLLPVVKPRLERKLTEDLERLKTVLEAD